MKEIIVRLDTNGNLEVEGEGFSGTSCRDATKIIRDLLMASEGEEIKKAEMFRKPKVHQHVHRE